MSLQLAVSCRTLGHVEGMESSGSGRPVLANAQSVECLAALTAE